MGYDISIVHEDGSVAEAKDSVPQFGSNVCIGGTTRLSVCITYNYAEFYRSLRIGKKTGLWCLDGKDPVKTIPKLVALKRQIELMDERPYINKLRAEARRKLKKPDEFTDKQMYEAWLDKENDGIHQSYWAPIPSNAAKAIAGLLWMAVNSPKNTKWQVC